MDLYTLTENFIPDVLVDQFASAIWTERYSVAGEVQLVTAATAENIEILAPGTFLALRGSKEVMELQTQEIKDGLMTVTGFTLTSFLNQRYFWKPNVASSAADQRVADYTEESVKPGEFIANMVDLMVINTVPFTSSWAPADLDWTMDEIPFLSLGPVDTSGDPERVTMAIGPLYDSVADVASKYGIGIALYLESADPVEGYSLKFTTYRGKDRTSDQSTYPLVRLLPDMDSLSDMKEIHANTLYKNVCYVYWNGEISTHYAEPSLPVPEGLERRVLVTDPDKEPVGHKVTRTGLYQPLGYAAGSGYNYDYTVVDEADIDAFREQNARDALANHNYIKAIDGQTSPNNDYQFGVDYGLGDLIELKGITGTIGKARITEYIRSQDKFGERNYPTISVVSNEGT